MRNFHAQLSWVKMGQMKNVMRNIHAQRSWVKWIWKWKRKYENENETEHEIQTWKWKTYHERMEVLGSYHIIGTDLSCMKIIHAWKWKWNSNMKMKMKTYHERIWILNSYIIRTCHKNSQNIFWNSRMKMKMKFILKTCQSTWGRT